MEPSGVPGREIDPDLNFSQPYAANSTPPPFRIAEAMQPIERERGRELQLKLDPPRELEPERKLQLELAL